MANPALELPKLTVAHGHFGWLIGVRRFLGKLIFNLIPFVIVAVFFWIQTHIDRSGGLGGKAALAVVTVVEIGLVYLWSLFI